MFKNWKSRPNIALAALVGITAVWGGTFLVVQDTIKRMPVMDFLAVRFTVATLVMLAVRPGCLRSMSRTGFIRAIGLGIVLGLGYITQTYGLQNTSASVSGFITGMFVGFIADSLGRRPVLFVLYFINAIGFGINLMSAYNLSYTWLVIGRIVAG